MSSSQPRFSQDQNKEQHDDQVTFHFNDSHDQVQSPFVMIEAAAAKRDLPKQERKSPTKELESTGRTLVALSGSHNQKMKNSPDDYQSLKVKPTPSSFVEGNNDLLLFRQGLTDSKVIPPTIARIIIGYSGFTDQELKSARYELRKASIGSDLDVIDSFHCLEYTKENVGELFRLCCLDFKGDMTCDDRTFNCMAFGCLSFGILPATVCAITTIVAPFTLTADGVYGVRYLCAAANVERYNHQMAQKNEVLLFSPHKEEALSPPPPGSQLMR